jgi:hypothetical protein
MRALSRVKDESRTSLWRAARPIDNQLCCKSQERFMVGTAEKMLAQAQEYLLRTDAMTILACTGAWVYCSARRRGSQWLGHATAVEKMLLILPERGTIMTP